MMVVMIEAGTTMPPIPRPAMISSPQSLLRLSTFAQERDAMPSHYISTVKGKAELLESLTSCHQHTARNHQCLILSAEYTEEP